MYSYLLIIYIPTIFCFLGNMLKIKKKTLLQFSFFFLFLVAAFRFEFGADYTSYYSFYNKFLLKKYEELTFLEIGYRWLNILISSMKLDFNILLSVISFVNLYFFYRFMIFINIKRSFYWIIFFTYISLYNLYFYHLSMIRQSIAIYIFLFSFQYIYKKEIKKYIIIILLATLFHKSAIILLPIYYINRINFKIKYICLFFICSIFFIINVELFVNLLTKVLELVNMDKYVHYINVTPIKFNTGIGFILNICSIFLFSYLLKLKFSKKNKLLIKMILISRLLIFLNIVGISILHRVVSYFDIYTIFIPCIIILSLENKIKKNKLYYILFCSYLFLVFLGYNLLFIQKYNGMMKAYSSTYYMDYLKRYKIKFLYEDKYKNKIFERDSNTGKIYFIKR